MGTPPAANPLAPHHAETFRVVEVHRGPEGESVCDCCGSGLRRWVVLEGASSGRRLTYGLRCAQHATGQGPARLMASEATRATRRFRKALRWEGWRLTFASPKSAAPVGIWNPEVRGGVTVDFVDRRKRLADLTKFPPERVHAWERLNALVRGELFLAPRAAP